MAPAGRGERIQQLFLEAARVPAGDRDQWLREHCDGDDQLLGEVRSLLQYDDLPVDPLESGLGFSAGMPSPVVDRTTERPVVPGYRVVGEIGTGGQAIVFEAIQESTTQRVAIKMLRWGQRASTEERERLRREVVILAQISHPGIVSIIDCGETSDGVFFIVMQFVDGHRLDELLELSASEAALFGSPSQDEYCTRVLRLFLKLCDAVDAAHRYGIVHRDLKPANILIDKLGEPRVLDFGLAKASIRVQLGRVDVKNITTSGQFMGSLPWASPEQAAGEKVDARSDVYSLGVILYQLLSGGQFPYDVSGSMGDVITKIMHADPTPLDQAVRNSRPVPANAWPKVELVDQQLNALVMKSLTKSREDRYQTARELKQAVEQYLGVRRDSDPTDKVAKRWSTKGVLIAAAFGVAIVAGLLAVFRPFPNVIGRGLQDPRTPSITDKTNESVWHSFDQQLSQLVDDDSITRTSEGWRIRDRDIRFSEVSSEVLVLRAVLRPHSGQPVILRLQSHDGTEIYARVSRKNGTNINVVNFGVSGWGFVAGQMDHDVNEGKAIELALAVLPDRVTLACDGRLVMQVHCLPGTGPWTPVLDAKSTKVDCIDLRYTQDSSALPEMVADVVPREMPAVEFIVRHGGAALSEPASHAADAQFQLFSLTTDGSSDPILASAIAKIAQCDRLDRLTLQNMREPDKAMEHLGKLKSLTTLEIKNSDLNGDCFHHFVDLDLLESLSLFQTHVRNPDFRPLQQLSSLERLWLTSIAISDADLELLADIKSLRRIAARGERVTAKGVRSLLRLPEFQRLELHGAKLSG